MDDRSRMPRAARWHLMVVSTNDGMMSKSPDSVSMTNSVWLVLPLRDGCVSTQDYRCPIFHNIAYPVVNGALKVRAGRDAHPCIQVNFVIEISRIAGRLSPLGNR